MHDFFKEKATLALYLLCIVPASILVFAFYRAELPSPGFSKERAPTMRSYIQDRLFDVRSIISPKYDVSPDFVLAEFTDRDVRLLQDDGYVWDEGAYLDIAERLLRLAPKELVIFMQPNWLSVESPYFSRLATLLRNFPNVYCASLGMNTQYPSSFKLPDRYADVSMRILGVEQFRKRKHDILRRFPLVAYRGSDLVELLWTKIASFEYDRDAVTPNDGLLLQYPNLDSLKVLDLTNLRTDVDAARLSSVVEGRFVFMNYDHYVELEASSDQVRANTPLQTYGDDAEGGVSVARLAAVISDNLRSGHLYRVIDTPSVLVAQAAIVAVFSLLIWHFGVALGLFLIVLAWLILLNGHGLLQHFFHIYVPLADSVLFSVIFAVFGILLQLTREAKSRAREEAMTLQKEEIASLQSRFLNQFGQCLSSFNRDVWEHLQLQEHLYKQNDKAKLFFSKLKQSCQELGEYLQGIHQFSRLSNDRKISVEFESIELVSFIERILRQFESLIEENNVKIEMKMVAGANIYSDPNMLEPILFNLISNAIKYSPSGGVVTIELVAVDAKSAILKVSDKGRGISEEYLAKIFEKFYRIKDDYVYKIKGHGLGLYLCQYFATRLGTKIDVKSRKGEGSEFSLVVRRMR